jgi:hypothetical protein
MARQSDQPAGRPRRRKKGRSGRSSRVYWIVGGAVGGVALLALVIAAVVVLWPRLGPGKMTAPERYIAYDSPEDVFHASMPEGWRFQSGGRKGQYWVSAENGGAAVKVYESLAGSLLGDIAGAAQPDPNAGDELLPVSRVHEVKRKLLAEEYADYREEPAVTVGTGFGKARRSAFTARPAGLGGKVRGYRVTALGAMTQVTVVCTCSPGDWDALEPAFARVIASVGPGPSPPGG